MRNVDAKTRRRIPRESYSHFLVGFVILVKAYAKLEHHPDKLGEVIMIALAGIFIILGTIFHHRLEKRIRNFTATFHIAEGLALIFIGFIFLREGGSRLQYFYFFLGFVYVIIGSIFLFAREERKERLKFQVQLWIGVAFLAAGAVTFLLNRTPNGSPWADFTALVFAGAGLMMIVRRIRKKTSRALKA